MVPADYQKFANRPAFRIVTIARFGTTTRLSLAKFSPALRDCHVSQAEMPRKRNFSESIAAQSRLAAS
jgi:hypothetical protein